MLSYILHFLTAPQYNLCRPTDTMPAWRFPVLAHFPSATACSIARYASAHTGSP